MKSKANLQTNADAFPGALSEEEIAKFYRDGLIGPFDSPLSEKFIDNAHQALWKSIKNKDNHPLYERFSVRDWHLVYPEVSQLITHPCVSIKLRQILGENLTLWRSKLFHKRPGDGAIEWHQEWGAFNGEEIGNDKPSLVPAGPSQNEFWNLTIWVALHDVELELGAMQFVKGSYKHQYPIDMISMVESAFWQDPFLGIDNKQELIEQCKQSRLILDIDSSGFLDGIDCDRLSMAKIKAIILEQFAALKAATTLDFDITPENLITLPMKKGQYVIFPERTMHRSIANTSDKDRLAINFRVTRSETLIYPSRLDGDFIDGSNLNIKAHKNVLVSGNLIDIRNVY
jgi:non-haem Fe2+, alpha-ketoglutarate-dependent halogenase